jgi:hypothetical protein
MIGEHIHILLLYVRAFSTELLIISSSNGISGTYSNLPEQITAAKGASHEKL